MASLLTKKHKNTLIGGLITVILTALMLWVNGCFEKKKPLEQHTTPTIKATAKDSSTQVIAPITVTANDSSKIKVEISPNKKETHNHYPPPAPPKEKKDDKRHISKQDINIITSQVPKSCLVTVAFSSADFECNSYGYEILNKLREIGYKVQEANYGMMATPNYNPRFNLVISEDKTTATVTVYVLRK